MLAPWKKSYYQPRQHIKSRDITLPTKVCLVKSMFFFFPSSHVWMWELDYKVQRQRTDDFELWCWRSLLRVSWIAKRSNQSILKEINTEYSLEGLMLKLKLQYFGQSDVKNWLIGKDPDAGKDWRQEGKGTTEDEMVGWHLWLVGHEFEQTPGAGDGQGSLVCCSSWDLKQSDMTEWLNRTELNYAIRGALAS